MKKIILITAMLATSTASVAADKEFTSRDKNNDGMLSVQEWIGSSKNATKPEFIATRTKTHKRLDKNDDGFISAQEWAERNNKK